MNKFCGACGAPVPEGAGFCGSCGASAQQVASPAPQPEFQPVAQPVAAAPTPQPQFQPVAQPVTAQAIPTPAPAAKASSPWLKIVIVVVVVIFALGAVAVGGVIYVVHKVSQKAHEYSREVLGETPPTRTAVGSDRPAGALNSATGSAPSSTNSGFAGDACRLLSKEDVSRAIGVDIVETQPADGGCSYLAKGTAADMTAKHTAAMVGAKGADKKTQGMIEQFAGVIGNNLPKNATSDTETGDGNVVVLTFGIDTNSAEVQMRLNSKVLGRLGPSQQALDGIGDEAFAEADSMMFVRKGDKLIRIMYTSCPCSTDAIKPLAKEIIANL
jgi:hypothetical protein